MESEEFYCPTNIDLWFKFLVCGVPKDGVLKHHRAFIKNIGYNLQYLEFLDHQFEAISLHATVEKQLMKSFVVTGMGIVEAIASYLLKRENINKKSSWKVVDEVIAGKNFRHGDTVFRVTNRIESEISEQENVEMSLDWMIKKVEKKKLLGIDGQVYRDLNHLRKMRNKVHIHDVQHDRDTDWNAFSPNELKLMKKALFGVFTSKLFNPTDRHLNHLGFLRVEESTDDLVDEIPL